MNLFMETRYPPVLMHKSDSIDFCQSDSNFRPLPALLQSQSSDLKKYIGPCHAQGFKLSNKTFSEMNENRSSKLELGSSSPTISAPCSTRHWDSIKHFSSFETSQETLKDLEGITFRLQVKSNYIKLPEYENLSLKAWETVNVRE